MYSQKLENALVSIFGTTPLSASLNFYPAQSTDNIVLPYCTFQATINELLIPESDTFRWTINVEIASDISNVTADQHKGYVDSFYNVLNTTNIASSLENQCSGSIVYEYNYLNSNHGVSDNFFTDNITFNLVACIQ